MIVIYRRAPSDSALLLAEAVGGVRVRSYTRLTSRWKPGDKCVCWGESWETGLNTLNGSTIRSKYQDAITLAASGVPTIQVARQRPQEAPQEFYPLFQTDLGAADRAIDRDEVRRLIRELQAWLAAAPAAPEEWLARRNNHVGGNDLLADYGFQPDYWVKKETLINEYRVHSFRGKSIRAGQKIPARGVESPHQWIRSYDGGWRICYHGEAIRNQHRQIAHQAVQALGLDFGAVDIGERSDGSLLVLEVNRAPGLEGGTVIAYANAIKRWVEGS